MSEERLDRLIEDFSHRNLNLFFRNRCENYAETQEDLSQYHDERFSDFQKLGEIRFDDGQRLVVATSRVSSDLSERSSKKAQYEKARKILRERAVCDAGFFVFYDDAGSFRFSLVYGQAEGTRRSWSSFRRFTYFVSRDQTNRTFRDRIGSCTFSSLDVIRDAFSVEKVTKEFYRQIADWYFWAIQSVRFPKDAEAEENGRNIAVIRLITRLIFIWFMKQRKLVSPDLFDKETARGLLVSLHPRDTTYYKAILQNLFFATLNTKIDEREFRFTHSYHGRNTDYMNHGIYRYEDYFRNREDMLALFKDIPFLNGGLFDCLDWSARESGMPREVRIDGFSDKDVGLSVPNLLFFSDETEADLNAEYGTKNKKYRIQGLLNILWAYNFTIDENDPIDQEVALDPELLGKVFENLLASFNPETATTARKATGSYYTPREIVDHMVTQSLKQYYRNHLEDVADTESKLEELMSPITDDDPTNPFGPDDSKEIVRLTEELRIVDPAVGSGAFPMGILNKLVSVLARVDPDNRLWQEAQLKAVEGVTDRLLRQKLIEQINEQFSERNSNYGRKLYLIQKCIYGVDIQQIAIEIAKLRFFIALLVDERIDKSRPNWGIEPLPNLDFKLMQGNSLISEFMGINLDSDDSGFYGKLMQDETEELISEYKSKKTDYQYEPDRARREALKQDIHNLIVRIFESKLQSQKAEYLTKLKSIERRYAHLPDTRQRDEAVKKDTDTLNGNYGFDLAQAERQLKEFTSGLKVRPFFAWKLYFAEVFHEKGGFDVVIANPPYVSVKAIGSRDKEVLSASFESGEGRFNLFALFIERGHKILKTCGLLTFILPEGLYSSIEYRHIRRYILENAVVLFVNLFSRRVFEAAVDTSIIGIKKECRSGSQFRVLRDLTEAIILLEQSLCRKLPYSMFPVNLTPRSFPIILRMMTEGFDHISDILEIQQGIIYSGQPKNKVFSNSPMSSWYKPVLDGRDVLKWKVNWGQKKENRYIAYTQRLHRPREERLFLADEKILLPRKSTSISCAYDADKYYALNTSYLCLLKNDRYLLKYILACLNSRLINYFYSQLFFGWQVTIPALNILPVRRINVDEQTPYVGLVDQILSITADEDYLYDPVKQAGVKELEHQIDQMIYQLYDLTPEEIAVVEGASRVQGSGL